jgi:hypothetical protein
VSDPAEHGLVPRSALGELTVAARGLLFRRSKLSVWRDALRATETYVTPPLDEYEQPSEIPLLEVNRITANPLLLRDLPTLAARRHASLFAQLQRATANFGEASWRKSYVSIQDAGQQRAFKVKFVGEGVDDHGGPYRALFSSCAVEEPAGCLELLVPVPNERGG